MNLNVSPASPTVSSSSALPLPDADAPDTFTAVLAGKLSHDGQPDAKKSLATDSALQNNRADNRADSHVDSHVDSRDAAKPSLAMAARELPDADNIAAQQNVFAAVPRLSGRTLATDVAEKLPADAIIASDQAVTPAGQQFMLSLPVVANLTAKNAQTAAGSRPGAAARNVSPAALRQTVHENHDSVAFEAAKNDIIPAVKSVMTAATGTGREATDAQSVWLNRVSSDPVEAAATFASTLPARLMVDKTALQPLSASSAAALAAPNGPALNVPTLSSSAMPVSNAPLTAYLTAQFGSQEWQQQLGQQVMLLSNRHGEQNAQLRLHPQELGMLHVNLKIENGLAQLHFASAHSQVRTMLEAMMPGLRNALAEGGIALGQSSVSSDTSPQWQQAQQDFASVRNPRQSMAAIDTAEQRSVTASRALSALAAGRNGIDIFA